MGASPMQSPRLGAGGSRQPLKPLVHPRTVLQETMREVNLLLKRNTFATCRMLESRCKRDALMCHSGFLRADMDSSSTSMAAC